MTAADLGTATVLQQLTKVPRLTVSVCGQQQQQRQRHSWRSSQQQQQQQEEY